MATLGEMLDRIDTELHGSFGSVAQAAVFSAIARFRSEPFWFTEGVATLTAVTNTINLATALPYGLTVSMVQVHDGTDKPALYEKTWEELAEKVANDLTGTPSSYTVHANLLYLYPAPSSTMTVEVTYAATNSITVTNTATGVWFTEAEELIRTSAKVDLCENYIRDYPQADRLRMREAQILQELTSQTVARMPRKIKAHL